jgi:hypothetical protein
LAVSGASFVLIALLILVLVDADKTTMWILIDRSPRSESEIFMGNFVAGDEELDL